MLDMLTGMNMTGFHLLTEKSFNSILCLDHNENEVIKRKKSKVRWETREEKAAWCKPYSFCCLHAEGAELHYCTLPSSLFSKIIWITAASTHPSWKPYSKSQTSTGETALPQRTGNVKRSTRRKVLCPTWVWHKANRKTSAETSHSFSGVTTAPCPGQSTVHPTECSAFTTLSYISAEEQQVAPHCSIRSPCYSWYKPALEQFWCQFSP